MTRDPELSAQQLSSTILIVEDELLVRMLISDHLRDEGFVVMETDGVEEAMMLLATTDIDFVFTDINMPGKMDGCDLASWTRANYPEIGFLMTSGKIQTCSDLDRLPDGIIIVPKPYNVSDIELRIRRLINQMSR